MTYRWILDRILEGNKLLSRQIISFLKKRDKLTKSEWNNELKPLMKSLQSQIENEITGIPGNAFLLSNLKIVRRQINQLIFNFDDRFATLLSTGQKQSMELSIDNVMRQFPAVKLGLPSTVLDADNFMELLNPLTASMVTNFTSDMASIIGTEVALGMSNGESSFVVAKRIRDKFESSNMSFARAERIATTEMNRASALAQQVAGEEMAKENGDLRKVWINAHKPGARVTHLATERVSANRPLKIDELFFVGGEKALYPRAPNLSARNTVSCGCTVAYVNADDLGSAKLVSAAVEKANS